MRFCALGREVRQVGAEQLAGHEVERLVGEEVHAGDHGVGGEHQVEPRSAREHGHVVQQSKGLGRAFGKGTV